MKCLRFRNEDLRHQEWFQFFTEFKDLTLQFDCQALGIENLFAHFLTLFAQAEEAIRLMRKSVQTEKIVAQHNLRGEIYRGFALAIKANRNHFDPSKKEAAYRLMILTKHHGYIYRKTYNAATASLRLFINEIKTNFAADLSTLGLAFWVSQLEQANQTFDVLMQMRHNERADQTSLRMRSIRLETDKCFREILACIDALMLIENDAQCEEYIKQINVHIRRVKEQLAIRKGRRAAAEDREAE